MNVIETQDLRLLSTVALTPIFTPGIWGGGVEDIRDDVGLLVENTKVRPAGSQSKRIITGMEGEAYLTPGADRILFEKAIRPQGDKAYLFLGREDGRRRLISLFTDELVSA